MDTIVKKVNWNGSWDKRQPQVFFNPKINKEEKKSLISLAQKYSMDDHLWVASSGSGQKENQSAKLVALSKDAFLKSAESVNQFLEVIEKKDIWALALPTFHVGGLAIFARAHLSQSSVFEFRGDWNATQFISFLNFSRSTLTSLVPTQVYDLVEAKLKPSPFLRAVVVGGARLSPDLYAAARKLGWPLMPSYGMTECCSQVATATLESSQLKTLPHLQIKTNAEGFLQIKGSSLLTGFAQVENNEMFFKDPKVDGWYTTSDQGVVEGDILNDVGRAEDFVKINGEGVNLLKLRDLLLKIAPTEQAHLMAIENSRSGYGLVLFLEKENPTLIEEFNRQVLPFERITESMRVEKIPRSSLGKVLSEPLARLAKL